MVFTAQIFLFWFLPAVLGVYYLTPMALRSLVLVVASYVFYGWWRPDFLLLILLSTGVDFVCGRAIAGAGERLEGSPPLEEARGLERTRRRYLTLSICLNLGLLGYFKYANFGIESFNSLMGVWGLDPVSWPVVILPVGISFYTFQTMSYTIDVYRGEAPPVRRWVDFACYVALFPQLVAGPIVRYRTLAHQLRARTHSWARFGEGALLFQMGFVKKVLIADSLAPLADGVFALAEPTSLEVWAGVTAYAFQIYFDFSGYSDMALGLGRLFGFVFPANFASPYRSRSITEFWQRWHISLSTWLRDYLYVPLGGNRGGALRTYRNLALTMLLGGLWHGAAWTFVLWGAWQGFWLIFERLLGRRPFYAFLPSPLRMVTTFLIVLGGWVLFRATSMDQAFHFLARMVGVGASWELVDVTVGILPGVVLAIGALVVLLVPPSQDLVPEPGRWVRWGIPVLFVAALAHTFFQTYSPFLYFQF